MEAPGFAPGSIDDASVATTGLAPLIYKRMGFEEQKLIILSLRFGLVCKDTEKILTNKPEFMMHFI